MQAPSYRPPSPLPRPTNASNKPRVLRASEVPAGGDQSATHYSGAGASAPTLIALPARTNVRAIPHNAQQGRRLRPALLAARIVGDGLILAAASIVAYYLRYVFELGGSPVTSGSQESNLPFITFALSYLVIYVPVSLVAFQARGLYALPRGSSWPEQLRSIAGASLISMSLLVLGTLMLSATLPSRLLFVFLWLCTIALFGIERFLYRRLRIWIWRRGINIRRVLVVGAGPAGQRIMKDILEKADLGYELIGYVEDDGQGHGSPSWRVPIGRRFGAKLQRLGQLGDVHELICENEGQVHEVIVALPATHHTQILSIVDSCRQCGIEFRLVPDLFEMRFNEVRIDALNGVPLIGVKNVALHGFNLLLKRALDLILVSAALVLAAIPMLILAAVVRLTSPGPVLFRQQRVGKGGRSFTCFKFRSMYQDAEKRLEELRHLNEADGPLFKMKDDPRITPAGKVLRRTSLDELPQLFNILRGEMSWVGPRPPMPREVAQYDEWHQKRLEITPGLTGLWQVSGRSNLSFEEMVKLDLYYAESWSLSLDFMIMLRTLPVLLKREGAF